MKLAEKPFARVAQLTLALWLAGSLITSVYLNHFLHKIGLEDIPPELYGEAAGTTLAKITLYFSIPAYLILKITKHIKRKERNQEHLEK